MPSKKTKNHNKKSAKKLDRLLKEKKSIEGTKNIKNRNISSNNKKRRKSKNYPKKVIVDKETKQKLKNQNQSKEISDATLRFNELEEKIRTIYDEQTKEDFSFMDDEEKEVVVYTDVVIKRSEDEELPEKVKFGFLTWTIIILSIVFLILFIAFIAFIIYVCTY